MMEIEAKFDLADAETVERLQTVNRLAGYTLGPGQTKEFRDTYLDTAGRHVLAAGYACRQREQAGKEGFLITLKGLQRARGAVHRRQELELWLPVPLPPQEWPPGPLREQVLRWVGETPLIPLFSLQQTRIARPLSDGERAVAEMCLDEVHMVASGEEQSTFDLEVELLDLGGEEDLTAIVSSLEQEWGLAPQPRSKFERGLTLVAGAAPQDSLFTAGEHAMLVRIARREDLHGRRARALLALDQGAVQAEAGRQAGMSERRVRHWLAAFRQKRLDIFPARVRAQVAQEALPEPPMPTPPPKEGRTPEPWPLERLFEHHGVDRAHARTVADHAVTLFEQLGDFHGLPAERRGLVEMAALVYDFGLENDPDRHHVVGQEVLLAHPPAELGEQDRQIVAVTTYLHRKRIKAKKLQALAASAPFADLSASAQAETLAIAALVRIADGLDYSLTGTSRLGRFHAEGDVVQIEVTGPHADEDAARAQQKSDLWARLFEVKLRFVAVESVGDRGVLSSEEVQAPAAAAPAPLPLPESPGLGADDTMAEAARKTFRFHFQRMLYHEPGTCRGEDIEELHDMRVATRRMRAAMRMFADYLDPKQVAPFVRGLRRTGRALGPVRDLDVFREKIQRYLDTLPPEQQAGLDPLLAVWAEQRRLAREKMLAYLDSARYRSFRDCFGSFLQHPGAGALPPFTEQGDPRPQRLRHVVPVILYQALAGVRAYDEWVTGPDVPLTRLHQLRIAAKRLRYVLEFFGEILGTEADALIKQVKALQDHLGDLQDAIVACNLLRDFMTWGTWGHTGTKGEMSWPTMPIVAPGVATYLAARQMELQHLVDTFPLVWAGIASADFCHLLASAVDRML